MIVDDIWCPTVNANFPTPKHGGFPMGAIYRRYKEIEFVSCCSYRNISYCLGAPICPPRIPLEAPYKSCQVNCEEVKVFVT